VYDEDLSDLDEWIRRLKVEYDIFFNGNRKKPPDDLRARVEKTVKRLSEATDMSFSQRFRYTTLISRFHVYRDKWRRTQQDRESAEGASGVSPAPPSGLDLPKEKLPPEGVRVSISNPEAEGEQVLRLYNELLRMRKEHAKDTPVISYQQFADYVASQTQGIKKRYQCASVVFRIALEGKAVKFTAKADNSSSR
jgi:hypothetical protein